MRIKSLVGIVAGLSVILSACSGDADETTEATVESTAVETTAPTGTESTRPTEPTESTEATATTEAATETTEAVTQTTATGEDPGVVVPEGAPSAIVSLSPTATEMLYAIGAGDQVLAVDEFSTYPPEAADKMQGLSGFTPNVEAIAGLDPDLVITDGTNPDLLAQLDDLGIPHWEGPAAAGFDDVYAQIEELGAATGHPEEAAELIGRMVSDIAAITAELPDLNEPLTYYHELDDTYFSVTSDTFIGAVYEVFGLENIADEVGDDNPYPQLSAEFIVAADPDLIFLADTKCCDVTAESVADRDGWDALFAVNNGGVIEMDDDIASRWGPRVVDYLRIVGRAVNQIAARQPVG